MSEARIRLVTRADDAGSCHTANMATYEAVQEGIVRNVSIIVCGPAFEEAARMFGNLSGVCIGLHAAITSEWDTLKWGPVLPPEYVSSLVDLDGHFLSSTQTLHQREADADEILAEIEAQLERARAHGLRVEYFDEHMGFQWLPGVNERLAELAQREGLLRGSGTVPRLPAVPSQFDDPADEIIARLAAAPPGTYLIVGHPGYDTEEMRGLVHAGLRPGDAARQRDAQRRMFTSPKVVEYCRSNAVEPVRYPDVLPALTPGG